MSSEPHDPRLDGILETLLALAHQNFRARAPVGPSGDTIDAVAQGINMLADELDGEVASRLDLERAHAELKATQARLAHAGKLNALGQLASGVAHEINNPATGIEMAMSLAARQLGDARRALAQGERGRADLERVLADTEALLGDVRDAMARIRTLTNDLRTFSRVDGEKQEPTSLNAVVESACRLVSPAVRQRAALDVVLGDIPAVRANRGRLGQIVTNLIINAMQAVESGGHSEGGRVQIGTRREGDEVVLWVDDDGPGIPENLRERVLEPFFTTKGPGKGSGLGLALVADIVRSHSGRIEIGQAPAGGAHVEIRLPASGELPNPAATRADTARLPHVRVLLVDDEPLVLRTVSLWLEVECQVVCAEGGKAALEILARDQDFQLIVCDFHMPPPDGQAVHSFLATHFPALVERLVFATGGGVTEQSRRFLEETKTRILNKPFGSSELAALVRASAPER